MAGKFHTSVGQCRPLAEVVADALRRRVGPGRAIAIKQLAHALRVHENTVWGWLGGGKAPSGPALVSLIAFFDASFANEILAGCGVVVAKAADVEQAARLKQVNEASPALRSLDALAALMRESEA